MLVFIPTPRSIEYDFFLPKAIRLSANASMFAAICGDVDVNEAEQNVYGGLEAGAAGSR